nr:MAG TPA: hypothetical protein [Caudoviricetes sp.]
MREAPKAFQIPNKCGNMFMARSNYSGYGKKFGGCNNG